MQHHSSRGPRVGFLLVVLALLSLLFFSSAAQGQEARGAANANSREVINSGGDFTAAGPDDIQRLVEATNGAAVVSLNRATGVAGFVRLTGGATLSLARGASAEAEAAAFLQEYGGVFGVSDAASELVLVESSVDSLGATHLTYQQFYGGVELFGGILRLHFNAQNEFTAANGVFVPGIALNTRPTLSEDAAADVAVATVAAEPLANEEDAAEITVSAADLSVAANKLYVYRDGLAQGIPGPNYLVYEALVTDGGRVRELVYVNAHTGKVVNRVSLVQDALFRRLFEENTSNQVWQEGDPFPGSLNQDQQNIVTFSGHAYYHFFNAFGRDSYDGAGAELQSVNNDPTIACPNANWNGATTNYCNGVTSDDVVAHEWGHAYTEYTHDLIYQWQPGALNEAYSDIWGETVDVLNGVGTDTPAPVRTVNTCSLHTDPIPTLTVNSPASIAGDYAAAGAAFGPTLDETGVTGDVVLADDGAGVPSDACTPLVNGGDISGNIALVDRGSCTFALKVKNAQNAGAIGVVVANNVVGPPSPMGGADPTIVIPSVMISLSTGNLIKGELANGVNVTMHVGGGSTPEDSYRWLLAEDSTAFGGAIRDMWTPTCMADPGRVSDAEYACSTADNGGVHSNSGVPNHGFALLVDGGVYNGQTVNAIGLVKAAHIYWRAQSVYQTPTSGFADHADALEASCSDLIGLELEGLSTDSTPAGPSGQVITAGDCDAVAAMTEAVELRLDPSAQCNFQPLLQPNAPALCADTPYPPATVSLDDFEAGLGNWTLTNQGVFSGWPGLDWTQDTTLPGGRPGAAAFGADPDGGDCGGGAGDISGVMRMESGDITVPSSSIITPRLAFDHYIASEIGWDGGNLKISVNGGAFTLVPSSAFTFNPYNLTLNTAAAGNTNPLAGQQGFSGTDGGSVGGSWGQSQINLAALGVVPGDTVRLRYDFGMDGCTGIDGWYVDDVHVYTCELAQAPDCSAAVASPGSLWPPNHRFRPITVLGVTDANGDSIAITIDSIFQDEPVLAPNSGNTSPDGQGVGTATARVRSERVEDGNGRVYHINFTAGDGTGLSCSGEVLVSVPTTFGGTTVDDGALYDSTEE